MAFTFGGALESLKSGKCVARVGWNGKGMWLALAREAMISDHPACPDTLSGMTFDPFIFMKTASGSFVPWLASQTDILAEDWVIVE